MGGEAVRGRVLSVASECVPLLKTGGLADVVGALPAALAGVGWQMRVLMPAYRALRGQVANWPEVMAEADLFGGPGRVLAGEVAGISMLLLDAPHLYDRDGGPYSGPFGDYGDNPQRFAALSWMAARIAREGLSDGWQPQVLHAHDWQAGFAPAYLAYGGKAGIATVMTIHNIAFQGWAAASMLTALRLPAHQFHPAELEYFGGLSSLKAGLVTADAITTVSPTYAQELMRPEVGLGLQGVIADRAARVHGILNGVDEAVWSPESEPIPYSARKMKGKAENRAALCAEFGLQVPGPLAIVVSRLTDQKGIDLLPAVIPDFVAAGGGLLVLGSGDGWLETAMRGLAASYPGRVAVRIGYDEALSHRMFAGADAVLVPSRFEPCGLTQMYGLRYGTLPVVAAVGGLADTVVNANPAGLAAGVATGITFAPTDALAFGLALRRLVALHADPKQWAMVQRNAMKQPVGWQASAAAYATLYESLLR
ncbi:glycogen synthase GlgA [Rhodobacter ferrooxidans]|uniref:Glycogen synthase n=1 Tax=Rhodobacter ferrooxidans TaxID=371731 RepID=C8S0I8_9RHOB|nr:glycogen synthase GlgA [Rhodobacter sp. SW2]EEW25522.1 glycogen/starch synthase, ADP-glucose type [Rhodobacter sp. SW2]